MKGVISNSELLEKRAIILNEGGLIETQQISPTEYLNRLSQTERKTLIEIIEGITHQTDKYFRRDCYLYAIFAVGTITYDNNYWSDLEQVLKKDPTKKQYIENRGEDIDLVFCPDSSKNLVNLSLEREFKNKLNNDKLPTQKQIFLERKRILEKINIEGYHSLNEEEQFIWENLYDFRTIITAIAEENNWKSSEWSDGAEFGAHYFEVPKEYRKQYKERIVRVKGKNWRVENTHIEIPNSRTVHIYVDDLMTAPSKLYYERLINIPFSLLFTARTKNHFMDLINKKNGTYKPLPKYTKIKTTPRDSKDELPF